MSRKPRRNHAPAFKAQVALEAVRGTKILAEIARTHDLHTTQINEWRKTLLDRAADVFRANSRSEELPWTSWSCTPRSETDVGQEFFGRRAQQSGIAELKKMIDRDIWLRRNNANSKHQRNGVIRLPESKHQTFGALRKFRFC